MHRNSTVGNILHALMEHRMVLSLGLSVACGIVLQSLYPVNTTDPMLRLIALGKPCTSLGCTG